MKVRLVAVTVGHGRSGFGSETGLPIWYLFGIFVTDKAGKESTLNLRMLPLNGPFLKTAKSDASAM